MRSRFVNPKRKPTRLRPAYLAFAGLAALIAATDHADATDRRGQRSVESIESRAAGEPVMNQLKLQGIAARGNGEQLAMDGALVQVSVKSV